jgi:hypothetical protein
LYDALFFPPSTPLIKFITLDSNFERKKREGGRGERKGDRHLSFRHLESIFESFAALQSKERMVIIMIWCCGQHLGSA